MGMQDLNALRAALAEAQKRIAHLEASEVTLGEMCMALASAGEVRFLVGPKARQPDTGATAADCAAAEKPDRRRPVRSGGLTQVAEIKVHAARRGEAEGQAGEEKWGTMSDCLTDLSPMPFGKHGGTPMQDVPAGYLHWLWHKPGFDRASPVGKYIRENLNALRMENDDLIWDE